VVVDIIIHEVLKVYSHVQHPTDEEQNATEIHNSDQKFVPISFNFVRYGNERLWFINL
jgi:hypothetical protein